MHSSGGVFAPAHRALTLGIVLSITMVAIEGMAVATIMPSVALELGGLDGYGWAFSTFMLTSLVGAIAAGQVADRRSTTLPACVGFASFAVGLLTASSAPVWLVLLFGRAVQGLGAGALGSIAYVAVARGYPEALRPRLLALLSSAWIVPSLVGPAVAGQVAEHATWRLVFVGIVPPVALGAWMLLPALGRLPRSATPALIDGAAIGLVAASAADPAGGVGPDRVVASLRLTLGVFLLLFAASVDVLPLAAALDAHVERLG
jgi:MFS family permease